MLGAATLALSQMMTPPFRALLLKSVALAVAVLVALTVGLYRFGHWMTDVGVARAERWLGEMAHTPLVVLDWVIAFALGLGLIAGAVFLMPAVTALVASFFADDIAEQVERTHYPADPPGVAPPLPHAVWEGVKTALLAVAIYLCAAPFLLFAGFGWFVFFFATAYLLGREYFELAATRFRPVADAKRLRRANRTTVFVGGMFYAAFVSIPIVNLATPLFAMAFMVHLHKRLARGNAARAVLTP